MSQTQDQVTPSINLQLFERQCPICGTGEQSREFAPADFDFARLDEFAFASRKLPEYMHYRLLECRVCDVLYASPAPASAALEQAYDGASFDASSESAFAARTYGAYLKQIGKGIPDRKGALDIGTGDGTFLEQLLAAGFTEVQGVEPSGAPIAAATPHIRSLIRNSPFRSADFAPETFRLVTCFQTLEHVHDPLQLCQDVFRITKPGGAFFVVCHNRRAPLNRLLGKKSPIFDIEHLQLFSPTSVRALLRAAGFTKVKTSAVVNCYPISYWAKLLPLRAGLKDSVLRALQSTRAGRMTLAVPVGNLAAIAFR
jgi:SAM-dependent methyltransferase